MGLYDVDKLIVEARKLAAEFRRTTGKPLGISGEIAEYDAARLLNLKLCDERQGGYDAVGQGEREGRRVQIKARTIFDDKKKGQRVGQLKLDQEWDSVVLVLMDEHYETFEVYEALRQDVIAALKESEGRNNKRGIMSVAKFKAIAQLVWARDTLAHGVYSG